MARPVPLLALALAVMTLAPLATAAFVEPSLPLLGGEVTTAPLPKPEPVEPTTKAEPSAADAGPGVLGLGCSLGNVVTPLSDGVTQTASLTGETDASCEFSFSPSPAADTVRLFLPATTPNDFDLFVRFGAIPTAALWDCRPFSGSTTNETCDIPLINATTDVFVMVKRFSGTGGAFNLTATSLNTCSLGKLPSLANNVLTTGTLTNTSGASCVFSYAPSSQHDLGNFSTTSPATANFDVSVRKGLIPNCAGGSSITGVCNTPQFDCRAASTVLGALDFCLANLDPTATYYVQVRRTAGGGDFNLLAVGITSCSLGGGNHPLVAGVAVTASLTGDTGAACSFVLPAAYETGSVRFNMNLTTSNFDLYVRRGQPPTTTTFDCRPLSTGVLNETCLVELTEPTHVPLFAMVRRNTGSGDFSITAIPSSFCSLGGVTTPLADNVAQLASLTVDVGAKCFFAFVPHPLAGTNRVSMTPPTATDNFDLYVRKGSPPTLTLFDCRPLLGTGVAETCELGNDGSTLFAMVRRSSGSGQFSVTARSLSTCSLGPGNHGVNEGQPRQAALTADDGAACFFSFVPNVAQGDLARVELTSPAGSNFDLFLRKGSQPTNTAFDCQSALGPDVVDVCTVEVTDATPVFALVRRASGVGEFSVVASTVSGCSLGLGVHALQGASLLDANGAKCVFQWSPDATTGDGARFVLTPPAGANFDVYVKKGALPTTTVYDCRPLSGIGVTETCDLEVADGTAFFAMVRRSASGGAFDLTGAMFNTCGLGFGVHDILDGFPQPTTLSNHAWAKCLYRLPPNAQADFVRFAMQPPSSGMDPDLYVKKGAMPTATVYDCRPFTGGTATEECSFLVEDGSTYFAMVKRFSGSGTYTLTGTNVVLPTLQLGVPVPGNVDPGKLQYFKVILPANATSLTIATAGDPTAPLCTAGACSPVPALADPTLCAVPDQACAAYTEARNVTCVQAPDACGTLARSTDADLYVQYRTALPTTTAFSCKSATWGSVESCTFSTVLNQTAGDPVGQPAEVRPFPTGGAGKYFIGVHGKAGPARYVLTAAWVVSPVPLPSAPEAPPLPPLPAS